jgi:hypothetical protein
MSGRIARVAAPDQVEAAGPDLKPRRARHRFGPRAVAAVVEALDGGASVADYEEG